MNNAAHNPALHLDLGGGGQHMVKKGTCKAAAPRMLTVATELGKRQVV